MITIGCEALGVRATMGALDHHGHFHERWPCVFILWRGRRL